MGDRPGHPRPRGAGDGGGFGRATHERPLGVWLGGAYRDRLEAEVDGGRIAVLRNHLEHFGQYTQLGELQLTQGTHRVTLGYGGPDLHPGSGGPQFEMGPLVLSRTTADLPVTYVRPAEARKLCGKNLDWIEALGS